jgi:hypothetical protein
VSILSGRGRSFVAWSGEEGGDVEQGAGSRNRAPVVEPWPAKLISVWTKERAVRTLSAEDAERLNATKAA